MKIGVLTHNYPRYPGDFSGRFVEALSEELAVQGHQVTVLAPWDPAYVRRTGEQRVALQLYRYAPRASWHRLGYMRTMRADVALRGVTYLLAPGFFLAGALAVMRWAAAARPDVLHAHWVLPNGFLAALAARRYGIPLVVSIPGSDATVASQNPLFGRMARFAFDTAGLITTNATELRDAAVLELGADPRKFDLIAYGVDPNALKPDSEGTTELRDQLRIPHDAVVLLAVGRMVYKKGFEFLLQAAAYLRETNPELFQRLRLVMVGEGDLWEKWQEQARILRLAESVHWVGNVPTERMAFFNNMADIAVMPAISRPATGLAVSVLDAMSCAKPVVGSDAAGNRLAVHDGVNGYLVPERDVPALAHALARLAADPQLRKQMGAASRRLIEMELGWPQLAQRYVAHYKRLEQRP